MAIGRATTSDREALLSKKIRTQASQLAQLNETLQQEGSYSRLLERRLLQLDPEHPLPVTPQHLGRGSSCGSRRLQQKNSSAAGGEYGRRNDHEDGDDIPGMRQGYAAAQERLKDAAKLIRTLREALASRYGADLLRVSGSRRQAFVPQATPRAGFSLGIRSS